MYPTAIGQLLLAHFKQVSMLEDALRKKAMPHDHCESLCTLAVAINAETLSTWFIDAIEPLLKKYKLIIQLFVDDQEKTLDFLRKGKVWGCVTSVKDPPSGCISSFLGHMSYHFVATPEFRKNYFPKNVGGKELVKAPAAIYGEFDYMHFNFLSSNFKVYKAGESASHYVPSAEGLVQFAVGGLAYVLLPYPSICKYLQNGRLVDLLPGKKHLLPLYWQTQELQTEITSAFSKQIISHAKNVLLSK